MVSTFKPPVDGRTSPPRSARIRDVDIASETAAMSRNQVLMQAGAAVLSQANLQAPQMALSLLRGCRSTPPPRRPLPEAGPRASDDRPTVHGGLMTLTITGLGSGLDTSSLISSLVSIRQQPITALQTRQRTVDQASTTISGFSTTPSSPRSPRRPARSTRPREFQPHRGVLLGRPTSVTASTVGGASRGGYDIQVTRLAREQRTRATPSPRPPPPSASRARSPSPWAPAPSRSPCRAATPSRTSRPASRPPARG